MKHTNESPAAPAAQNSAETAANITGSAAVCQQQAELLVSQGRATEAEPVYRRGLEIAEIVNWELKTENCKLARDVRAIC